MGTWIEMLNLDLPFPEEQGRSLRGNVDRNFNEKGGIKNVIRSFPTWERG